MAKRGAATSARPARPRRSAVKAGPVASRTAAAAQVEGFIDKFDPAMARLIRACRAAVRKRLPTTIELVYDNYNFFVIGYSSTERPSDCIVTLASNAKGVGLSFYYGSTLPDPAGILQGSGTQNRFVRLRGPETLREPRRRRADRRRGGTGRSRASQVRRRVHHRPIDCGQATATATQIVGSR